MSHPKTLIRFFVIFLACFGAAMAICPLVGGYYGVLFRGAGETLAVGAGNWRVKYSVPLEGAEHYDVQLLLRNRIEGLQRDVNLSSRRMAYMPTTFLLALLLATPLAWRSKRLALLWGFIWVNGYIAAKLALIPSTYIEAKDAGDQPTILKTLNWVLSGSSSGWMIVPLLIWILVVFRSSPHIARVRDAITRKSAPSSQTGA